MKSQYVKFRRSLTTIFISLFLGVSLFGQSNLRQKQGVRPTEIDLNNVFFLSKDEGSAVGYGGLMLYTVDGGRADLAVFRNGTWHIQKTASGYAAQQFGLTDDVPVPNTFVP
ncbi:MAG TPA: hypothetical protein VGC76_14075 [Pyrinomonadaceae bacterium]|jgi:hypothetical protein